MMKRIFFATAASLITFSAASPSSATTLSSDSSVSSSGGLLCLDFDPLSATTSCTGTRYYAGDDGLIYGIDYAAQASATAGELKTRAALSNRAPVDVQFDTNTGEYFIAGPSGPIPLDASFDENTNASGDLVFEDLTFLYDAIGVASLRETMTVSGGAGTNGTSGQLKLSYQLDGATTAPSNTSLGLPSGPGSGSAAALFNLTASKAGDSASVSVPENGSIDQTVDLFLDIVFGEEFGLNVTMTSYVSFAFGDLLDDLPLGAYPLFTVSSEFFSTATLTGIEALDSNGGLIDFQLKTASGERTFEQFSTLGNNNNPPAVPLPAGMTLMLSSAAALGLMRRRKQSGDNRADLQ